MPRMQALTTRQALMLVGLTLVWGLNWPVMKVGVTGFPPLSFRMISLWIGVPLLGLGLLVLRTPLRVPRAHWGALFWLARIFHRSSATNEDGIALVCSKIQVSNLDQASGQCRSQTVPKKLTWVRWTLAKLADVWWRVDSTVAA
jgi:hypothetical protein